MFVVTSIYFQITFKISIDSLIEKKIIKKSFCICRYSGLIMKSKILFSDFGFIKANLVSIDMVSFCQACKLLKAHLHSVQIITMNGIVRAPSLTLPTTARTAVVFAGEIWASHGKKTGPEEAQYFHVRPPIGFI